MWTKYDYICTHCDALFEITTSNQGIEPYEPDCSCLELEGTPMSSGIIRINKHDVTSITPTEVVKINTNPYN
jgi:hypothetical protein